MKKSRILALVLCVAMLLGMMPAALADEAPTRIVWCIPDYYGATGIDKVEARVNEITIPAINVEVDIEYINFGDYRTQLNNMLTGDDQVDIVYCWQDTFLTYTDAEFLQPLNGLLEEYGQGILNALNDNYWNALSVGGEIFSVGSITEKAVGTLICMDKALVDKYNIDVSSIKTVEDLTPIFETIKQNEPEITPLVPYVAGGAVLGLSTADFIDGSYYACLLNGGQDDKVSSWYETEEFASRAKLAREWNQAGYILKDADTNQYSAETLVANGTAFSFFCTNVPAQAQKESRTIGREMVTAEVSVPFGNTSKYRVCSWGIPYNSASPEAAMKFLNLLYTNADLANTMAWGVEGVHWVWNEDGQMTYPEGVDGSTTDYACNADWMYGNMNIMGVWETDPANLRELFAEFNKSTPSRALGFAADISMLSSEKAALQNVYTKYNNSLLNGTVDPETTIPQFIQELKDAGLDTWVAEITRQYEDWQTANNK